MPKSVCDIPAIERYVSIHPLAMKTQLFLNSKAGRMKCSRKRKRRGLSTSNLLLGNRHRDFYPVGVRRATSTQHAALGLLLHIRIL